VNRTTAFLSKGYLPAVRRAGFGPVGFFNALIAPASPFVLTLTTYPSLGAMPAALEALAADAEYRKALADYDSGPDAGFTRMESSLLRTFESFPAIETLPPDPKRAPRIFELRTYESNNESTQRQKRKMFETGEIGIFRRLGFQPVFFAETIVGPAMPNNTYMVSFADLAAREKLWAEFQADPEWAKTRAMPEYSDPGLTINITNAILRPLDFSDIR
jgi:NIPSNAP